MDLWRDGTLAHLEQARPSDAKVAYLTAAQVIYERYRRGAAMNFRFDLEQTTAIGPFPDVAQGLTVVMTARGLGNELPGRFVGQSEGPISAQITGLMTGTMHLFERVARLLQDQMDHQERLAYLAGHDPIVPLCQV